MILKCDDVSIRYITGDFKDIGLKEYITRHLTGNYHVQEFWADRHVSFSIEQGDMLGIIGVNGAGKSTLLKAISGIMVPTEGSVTLNGKISALLELGSGFDGDLTVRENAYLRGAMLGYTRAFMDDAYADIIDFAELWDFQERPFKQLSSGMKSRLAFSIASLLDPDILILDEVLSVGDGAFKKKSERKMREIISGGATTILVSHSLEQVRNMSTKILWLDKGRQLAFGNNVGGICDAYQTFLDTGAPPEAMPPMDLEPPVPVAAPSPPPPPPAQKPAAPDAAAPPPKRRKMPKALVVFLAALMALTIVIACSEAAMPGRVRALPEDAQTVLYASDDGAVQVCLWNNRLYFFIKRGTDAETSCYLRFVFPDDDVATQDTTLGTTPATEPVQTLDFAVQDAVIGRYSTGDTLIAEFNLAKYTNYERLEFGQDDLWELQYTP